MVSIMNNKLTINRLIMLMQDRINILKEINDLTILQQQIISDNDIDNLVINIDNKENLIKRLKEVNLHIDSVYKDVEGCINSSNDEYSNDILEIDNLKNKSNSILEEICSVDRGNKLAAKKMMDDITNSIKSINNNKKGISAYNMMGVSAESLYFDTNE